VSAATEHVRLRTGADETIDRASVLAVDGDDAVVGRAALSRLYGARGEVTLEAAGGRLALLLVEAVERLARDRGLERLELDASAVAPALLAVLRGSRPTRDDQRGTDVYLSWPTTPTR
jgi:hypothetical protein